MTKTSESKFIRHEPCEACGSSDAKGVYEDGSTYCFSCENYTRGSGENVVSITKRVEQWGAHEALPERSISYETCKKFNVTTDGKRHYYPYYDDNNNLIGTKVRGADKFFSTTGDMKNNTLFGQQLFGEGGKYVTVVEGELDALAAFEMLGSRWPVVSLSKGAKGAVKDFANNLHFLESFENVVICFDNDAPGVEAAEKAAQVLSPNKARIVNLDEFKDANDYLMNRKVKAFVNKWWEAKPYRMAGVVSLADAWQDFVNRGREEIIPFPESFGDLNSMLRGGTTQGEITVVGALTSIGKTTFVNEIVYHIWKTTQKTVGCAFLEATNGEAVENLLTIHTEHNLHLEDRDNLDYDALKSDIITDERIFLLDHHGAVDSDELFIKLRAMIKGNGCDVLVLDPLQAAVSSNTNEVVDDFMDRLLKLAKETNVAIILISHMRKPSATHPHAVDEYDLKGSGSINQIAFNTILLSRDKMAEEEYAKNSTKVQVVKCRRTGRTGHAGWVYYNWETGRLEQGVDPEIKGADDEEEF